MRQAGSRVDVALFMGVTFVVGCIPMMVGLPRAEVVSLVVLMWACGALWQLGRIDSQRFRIDPWWLFLLVGAGALWQAHTVGPDVGQGLVRALAGSGVGFLAGAVPLVAAEALGRRWPFHPGDVLLFAALGFLLGPFGLFWALLVGALVAVTRHVCVQRRRGRSWLQGHVPLGPGMALGGFLALWTELNAAFGTDWWNPE